MAVYELGDQNANHYTTPQVPICVNLNFDDKIKIFLHKNKNSGPSRDGRDKALGLGTRVYLIFRLLALAVSYICKVSLFSKQEFWQELYKGLSTEKQNLSVMGFLQNSIKNSGRFSIFED